MGTTAEKLQNIVDAKAATRAAISSCGLYGIQLGDKISQWPEDLTTVKLSGDVPAYACYMAFGGKNTVVTYALSSAPYCYKVSKLEVAQGTRFGSNSIAYAFQYSSISSVPNPFKIALHGNGAAAIATPCSNAFRGCPNISGDISVDISEGIVFDGTPVLNVCSYMFNACDNISAATVIYPPDSLPLTSYGATNFTGSMFAQCQGLKRFTMRGLSADCGSKASNANTTFDNCSALEEIEFSDITLMYGNVAQPEWNTANWRLLPNAGHLPSLSAIYMPNLLSCNIGYSTNPVHGLNSPFINVSSTLKEVYLPKCTFIGQGSLAHLTCTVHFALENEQYISACAGYADNFNWTRADGGTKDGSARLVFDL